MDSELVSRTSLFLISIQITNRLYTQKTTMPKNITYEELETLADCNGKVPNWDSDKEAEGYLPPTRVQSYIDDGDSGRVAAGCPRPTCYCKIMALDEKLRSKLRAEEKREKEAKRSANKKKHEDADKLRLEKKLETAKALLKQGKSIKESVAAASAHPDMSHPNDISTSLTHVKPPPKKKRSSTKK